MSQTRLLLFKEVSGESKDFSQRILLSVTRSSIRRNQQNVSLVFTQAATHSFRRISERDSSVVGVEWIVRICFFLGNETLSRVRRAFCECSSKKWLARGHKRLGPKHRSSYSSFSRLVLEVDQETVLAGWRAFLCLPNDHQVLPIPPSSVNWQEREWWSEGSSPKTEHRYHGLQWELGWNEVKSTAYVLPFKMKNGEWWMCVLLGFICFHR